MGVTISLTDAIASVLGTRPIASDTTSTLVTSVHEGLSSSVRFATMVTWAILCNDASFVLFIVYVSVKALTARFAVVVKVWVNLLLSVHVVASSLDWQLALNKFLVGSTCLSFFFTSSIGTLPVTLVALADVAIVSSAFASKVFS